MANNTTDFNADELDAPAWMNEDFFVKVLKNCESKSENLKILHKRISPASMKGDHYASIMFRAQIDYELNGEKKSRSLIIKTMPENEGHKKDMFEKSDIFIREIMMYTEVLPRFEKILRDAGDETLLKGNCLYHALEPHQVIIFEDLVHIGYEVIRNRALNEVEVKAAYTKLAKWHAISYNIILEEPHYFDLFQHSLFTLPGIEEQGIMTNGINFFIEMLHETPSLNKYLPYFEKLQPKLLKKCAALSDEYRKSPQSGVYYVLCHGDFHEKNMMFKYNKNISELEDVILLDFQMGFVGSIVHDLIYSFYVLLNEDLRLEFPALLYHYYTIFTDTLKSIGFKGQLPKLTKLHEELIRQKYVEFFLLVTFLPMWYFLNVEINLDIEKLMTSDEFRRKMYKTEPYIKYVEKTLPRYLHLGYFEDL